MVRCAGPGFFWLTVAVAVAVAIAITGDLIECQFAVEADPVAAPSVGVPGAPQHSIAEPDPQLVAERAEVDELGPGLLVGEEHRRSGERPKPEDTQRSVDARYLKT